MRAIRRFFFLLIVAAGVTMAGAKERPNFIVIFTDDQGYADLGAHGLRDDVDAESRPSGPRMIFTSAMEVTGKQMDRC